MHGRIVDSLKTEKEIKEMASIHAATREILRSKKINLNRNQKKAIRFELTREVSFSTAKELVGGAYRTIRRIRALTQDDVDELWDDDGPSITDTADDTSTESEHIECLTLNMYATFFIKHSGVLSGADRTLRTLAMPKHKLLSTLFGEIPSMLRTLVTSHKNVLSEIRRVAGFVGLSKLPWKLRNKQTSIVRKRYLTALQWRRRFTGKT